MSSVAQIIRRRRRRQQRKHIATRQNQVRIFGLILAIFLGFVVPFIVIVGVAGYIYSQAVVYLPNQSTALANDAAVRTTALYDRTGNTLLFSVQPRLDEDDLWVDIEVLPELLVPAVILAEDPDYLETTRFSPGQVIIQLWRYIITGEESSSESITSNLVEQTVLPNIESTDIGDPFLRISLVAELERIYTPTEILEWYINTSYYGNGAYGIEGAAQVYLGKTAHDLSLDEIALLVSIPSAPDFNPFDNPALARERQGNILRNLFSNDFITQEQLTNAIAIDTLIREDYAQEPQIAPDFSVYAVNQVEEILDWQGFDGSLLISQGGLQVTTTLDLDLYYQSECVLQAQLAYLNNEDLFDRTLNNQPCTGLENLILTDAVDRGASPNTGRLLIIDVRTGEIKSMVGDTDTSAYQPAALLQPFVYFEGFRSGNFTPSSMVLDIPQSFPGPADGLIYTPSNTNGTYKGPLNIRDAMAGYRLPPAVTVADQWGINRILSSAHRLGINGLRSNNYDLSLLERDGTVSLMDMTYAYTVFASQGVMRGVDTEPILDGYRTRNPVAILKVEDNDGNVLWEYDQTETNRIDIFDSSLAYLINDILADHTTRRSVLDLDNDVLQLSRPTAVISTTPANRQDSWTLGYTTQYVTGIHFNRGDGSAMSVDPYSLAATAPVWRAMMTYIHERDQLQPENWVRPDGISEFVVCEISGLIPPPNSQCPRRTELFLDSFTPTQLDTYWQAIEVNRQTEQRATATTPADVREEIVYFIPPEEASDWWQANALPLPPEEYDVVADDNNTVIQITAPEGFAYVGGTTVVGVNFNSETVERFEISYGRDVNPTQWFQISEAQEASTSDEFQTNWNTDGLDGIYTLRVTAVLSDETEVQDFAQLRVDNAPPTIQLQAGAGLQSFSLSQDTLIPLVANAQDNLAIDRVVFYQNGLLLGTDRDFPYGFELEIEDTGIQIFEAIAYDQVGNRSQARLEVTVTE